MSMRIRDTAATRTAVEARFHDGDGATKPIERMYARTESGIGMFYERGIRVAANPTSAEGYSNNKAGPITTNTVTVSITGGSAPYRHSWAVSGRITALNPSGASTAFSGNPPSGNGDLYATATDTVTDANGLTASVSVDVSVTREGFY